VFAAEPDVITKEITKDHEFLVLACDGIWDVLNNQDVVEFVRERLAKHMEPELVRLYEFIACYKFENIKCTSVNRCP